MIVCPKCGKELADGTKFCSKCGASLVDVKPAEEPKAEAPKKEEAPKAEAPKKEEAKKEEPKKEEKKAEPKKEEKKAEPKKEEAKKEEPKKEEAKKEEPKKEEPKKEEAKKEEKKADPEKAEGEGKEKFPKEWIKYIGIGAAVLVFLILLIALFSGGGKKGKAYALYLKDEEIMYSNLKPKKAWQVTTKLSKNGDMDNEDLLSSSKVYECTLSEDGKILFFPDKIERSDDGTTLYFRYTSKPKKEPVKMDSEIDEYHITESGSLVTYQKTSGDIYQYNVKKEDKVKIASEVSDFRVNEDGSQVVYRKTTGELYIWNKKDSEKLDSDVKSLNAVYGKTVYYTKDGNLYKKVGTKDKEKVVSDLYYVVKVYEGGQIYYVKKDDGKTLYYYNGKESEKVADNLSDVTNYSSQSPIVVYSAKESESDSKASYYVAIKTTVSEIEQEDLTRVRFQKDGKVFYFIADLNKDGDEGDLYRANVSGSKLGKVEKYDTEVSTTMFAISENNDVVYFKDCSKSVGDLYFNKKKVDSDVYAFSVDLCEKTKQLYYLVDYSKNVGTLKVSKNGGKAKKVADDVFSPAVLPNGYVLYLSDYSTKYYKGELYLYKGGKPVKLDDEVSAILAY